MSEAQGTEPKDDLGYTRKPRMTTLTTSIHLGTGAPRQLQAGDQDAEMWQVFDDRSNLVPWVFSYDADAGILITYACNYLGQVAIDAVTGEPVTYAAAGNFLVLVNDEWPTT